MATLKKEQRPDSTYDGGKIVNESIGLDNPDFHYRKVGKDPTLKDFGRIGKHKDLGYVIVKENERDVVMACPKTEFEARQEQKNAKNDRMLRSAAQAVNDASGETMNKNSFALERGLGDD